MKKTLQILSVALLLATSGYASAEANTSGEGEISTFSRDLPTIPSED